MHCTSRETARVLASLGTLGLALALYANSLAGDFVFDDHSAIQVNPDVRWAARCRNPDKSHEWAFAEKAPLYAYTHYILHIIEPTPPWAQCSKTTSGDSHCRMQSRTNPTAHWQFSASDSTTTSTDCGLPGFMQSMLQHMQESASSSSGLAWGLEQAWLPVCLLVYCLRPTPSIQRLWVGQNSQLHTHTCQIPMQISSSSLHCTIIVEPLNKGHISVWLGFYLPPIKGHLWIKGTFKMFPKCPLLRNSTVFLLQVANIVGRSELFAAIFFLLALISYQRAGRKDTTTPSAWIFLTVALSAVSLLCKEQGVTVLGLCLVLEAKNFLLKPEKIVPVQSKNR